MSFDRQLFENIQSISRIASNSAIETELSVNEESIRKDVKYTIKVNAPNGHFNQSYIPSLNKTQSPRDCQSKQWTSKTAYVGEATGYDNNRDLYSQEQIRQAFNIIDINKDGVLTSDDISFFLDCMGEEYTPEEVKEMIKIASTDGEKVPIDDFKKIGKGKIVSFSGMKAPDPNNKLKATVLENLKSSKLSIVDPQQLSQQSEAMQITYDKFQVERAVKIEVNEEYLQEDKEQMVLEQRTSGEIKTKRMEFQRISMLNIERIIQNYNNWPEYVQDRQIASMLSISEGQARQLFLGTSKRVTTKSVVLDAILFCPKQPIERLWLVLQQMNRNQLLQFDEWLRVLQFMIGSDQRRSIHKRLIEILRDKRLDITREYDKQFILSIMEESRRQGYFVW